MIKSLLDDEENREEEENTPSRFFRKGRDREGILSIDLSSAPEDEPPAKDESELAIIEAIRSAEDDSGERSADVAQREPELSSAGRGDPDPDPEIIRHEQRATELEQMLVKIERELERERESLRTHEFAPAEASSGDGETLIASDETGVDSSNEAGTKTPQVLDEAGAEVPSFTVPYEPESKVDSIRKSGLAWSAAIVLFGSVVFMLVLGWFADLLIGSSPWGKVVGIVLGSLIGFVQFFRITSQILKPAKSDFEKVSLRPSDPAPDEDPPQNTSV
jgi:F0F1-type ATP synthase assembly protein I